MQTERVYYDFVPGRESRTPAEGSSSPFAAEIVELRPGEDGAVSVFLDKTIFYPEGGGQPGDRGTINGVPLFDVREKDGEILHLVSGGEAGKLKPGPAELVLDSRRRRDFTTLHTGQHLLSGIILRMTGRHTVSMHLGDEICTIDVDGPEQSGVSPVELNDEILVAIEEAVADAIEENHPVLIHLCPPEDVSSFPLRKVPPQGEEVIRVVEIEGKDFSPCCGTHLKSTAEIGMLRILGAEKHRGMTRITFIAGRRVLRDSRLLRQNAGVVSRALKVPVGETGKGLLEFLEKTIQIEGRLRILEEESARVKAEALLAKAALLGKAANITRPPHAGVSGEEGRSSAGLPVPAVVVESYFNEGIDEVLCIGRAAQRQTQAVLILGSEQDLKFAAFCTAKGFDLRPLLKDAFEAQGGRGGGGPSFFQGSFGTKEALDAFLGTVQNQTNC